MYEALISRKSVLFRCVKAEPRGGVVAIITKDAAEMLDNCRLVVDVGRAACTAPADKERLEDIPDKSAVNRAVSAAIVAGKVAIDSGVAEVDAYECRECEALRALPLDLVPNAVKVAASGGYVGALAELLARLPDGADLGNSAFFSARGGHAEALALLRDGGANLDCFNPV